MGGIGGKGNTIKIYYVIFKKVWRKRKMFSIDLSLVVNGRMDL